jgi:DNA (cytosine-5)-methyltransferase 1
VKLGNDAATRAAQNKSEKATMKRALDLFSGAGGAAMGLHQAGYEVVGVDIRPQSRYPFHFHQGDAFDWLEDADRLAAFDLIWASPKCQAHSVLTPTAYKGNHEVQLPRVLELLRAQDVPYIVENVQGTQTLMRDPVMLCGSMFALDIWRHRWFEIGNADVFFLLPSCDHSFAPVLLSGRGNRRIGGKRRSEDRKHARVAASGIDWMTYDELSQAIPPAYSRFLAEEIDKAVLVCAARA